MSASALPFASPSFIASSFHCLTSGVSSIVTLSRYACPWIGSQAGRLPELVERQGGRGSDDPLVDFRGVVISLNTFLDLAGKGRIFRPHDVQQRFHLPFFVPFFLPFLPPLTPALILPLL